ncbi:hypothetical protein DERP_013965 [Dermatophagoides pteronyssinus]|uniref:Uncharacterized protein n=1 Tax=Dermatophagoides pteronyssinus TaxID=6956 RepID=A0ABQ8IRM6_DERPT|nr:hypothetical protein DERP_013965 [Dermatophagoides pteronyssinus]
MVDDMICMVDLKCSKPPPVEQPEQQHNMIMSMIMMDIQCSSHSDYLTTLKFDPLWSSSLWLFNKISA